jgi:CRT10
LALDPSSFQAVNTHEEFCGDPTENGSSTNHLDISDSLQRIPGQDRFRTDEITASLSDVANHEEDDELLDEFADEFSDTGDDGEDDGLDIFPPAVSLGTASTDSTGPGFMELQLVSSSDEYTQVEGSEQSEAESEEVTSGDVIRGDGQMIEDEEPDLSMPGGFNSSDLHEIHVGSDGVKKVKLRHPGTLPALQQPVSRSNGPAIPTLHLSASHLRLFDANQSDELSIYCSEPLGFQWPMYYGTHPAIDRLNLTQYLPELGIVVIGTQIGRVAVCSLTTKGSNGPFGLRVDWILPFASQERNHERPLTHLLGMAIGPVQGHQLSRSPSVFEDNEDADESWLQDRVDSDGVSISFDPEMVRIKQKSATDDMQNNAINTSSMPKSRGKATPAKSVKRTRTPPPIWRSVKQSWPSRSEIAEGSTSMDEPWRGIQYSRRYRLMLTYYDQTVMTYELSRAAPYVGDPSEARPNWRNRDDF